MDRSWFLSLAPHAWSCHPSWRQWWRAALWSDRGGEGVWGHDFHRGHTKFWSGYYAPHKRSGDVQEASEWVGLEGGSQFWAEVTDHQVEWLQWTGRGSRTVCWALPQRAGKQKDKPLAEAWGKSKAVGWPDCEASEGGVQAGVWLTQWMTATRIWRRRWKSLTGILLTDNGRTVRGTGQ